LRKQDSVAITSNQSIQPFTCSHPFFVANTWTEPFWLTSSEGKTIRKNLLILSLWVYQWQLSEGKKNQRRRIQSRWDFHPHSDKFDLMMNRKVARLKNFRKRVKKLRQIKKRFQTLLHARVNHQNYWITISFVRLQQIPFVFMSISVFQDQSAESKVKWIVVEETDEKWRLLRHLVSFSSIHLRCHAVSINWESTMRSLDVFTARQAPKKNLQLDPLKQSDNVHSFRNTLRIVWAHCAMVLIDIFIRVEWIRGSQTQKLVS
jgi:hypothetical protein